MTYLSIYLYLCDNSNDFSYNLGKLDKHEEMAHCDISFHTQMICLLHIAIMARPLQELLMMVKAEQTKETAMLLQAWIQNMFLFFSTYVSFIPFFVFDHFWRQINPLHRLKPNT